MDTLNKSELNVSAGRWANITKTTYRPTDIEHSVLVPIAQAGAVAVAGGTAAAVFIGFTLAPWDVAAAWGVVISTAVFARTLADAFTWSRAAIAAQETYQSETAAQGNAESATLRLEVAKEKDNGNADLYFGQFPVAPELFIEWAHAVLEGGSISQNAWIGTDGAFTKPEYEALLGFLMRAGIVTWINAKAHAQGRQFTIGGKHALERLLTDLETARARAHADEVPQNARVIDGVGEDK